MSGMPGRRTRFEIDGNEFSTLDEFYDVISGVLIPGRSWGRNLDAFNDILRGGFGTPDGGFVLVWRNSEVSRTRLGSKFEALVEILRDHGSGGREPEDGVELLFE